MTVFEQAAQFISWCIEEYAVENKKKSKDVAAFFNKTGILDFLEKNWEILHTQGRNYVLGSINDLIKSQEHE